MQAELSSRLLANSHEDRRILLARDARNYQGVASIATHRNGHFNFTISAAGYLPQTLGLDIKKGQHNPFDVKMEKG